MEPTHIHIDAARSRLGFLPTFEVKRLCARIRRQIGKGSQFAQRDTKAQILAIEQELASR